MRPRSLPAFKDRLLDLRPAYYADGKALQRIPVPAVDEAAAAVLLGEAVHGWLKMGLEAAAAVESSFSALAASAEAMPPLELARDAAVLASGFGVQWARDLTAAAAVALSMPADPKALGEASAEALFAFCEGTGADLVAETRETLDACPSH